MREIRLGKKHIAVAAGLALVGAFAWFFLVPGVPSEGVASTGGGKPLALQGTLEGFEPGARVSYSILPDEGQPASGESWVDASGRLALPAYNLYAAAGRYLSYTIEVEENKKPVNLALTLDSKNGSIAVQGKGLDPSAEITLGDQVTKSDWAGMIREAIAGSLNDLGNEEGFRVALYGGVASDAVEKSDPRIIKVLASPGGGHYIDPLTNIYAFPYGCNDTLPPPVMYSFCIPGSMQVPGIINNYVKALMLMTEQLSAVMNSMMLQVGAMIDAKFQLETQRELQRLVAEAHKDYHPSELMCEFGSFMRSLSSSEEKAHTEKASINSLLTDFYVGTEHASSSESNQSEFVSRVEQFRTVYCDPHDNNNGLRFMCDHDQRWETAGAGGNNPDRMNNDIDYFRTMDDVLTLDIDFTNSHGPTNPRPSTPDEQDVLALAKNLYWPRPLPPGVPEEIKDRFFQYMDARHIYAAMNVAHTSYTTIAGMKSKEHPTLLDQGGYSYMQAMLRNFGMNNGQIGGFLGAFPSYYAQMEVLTKKIYQHPDFYTNLYDKPANVDRIRATLDAISLMQQRDFMDSMLRREMMTSLLLEQALDVHVKKLNAAVVEDVKNLQRR
ncbi:MAG: hypothetical protein WBK55_07090 [Alphaproteobacteria bacterium]